MKLIKLQMRDNVRFTQSGEGKDEIVRKAEYGITFEVLMIILKRVMIKAPKEQILSEL